MKRLILEDLDLLLETDANGLGNWEFGERKAGDEDEDYDGDGDLPVIEDMRIKNALLRFQNG